MSPEEIEALEKDRWEWAAGFTDCFVCKERGIDIHEIERRSAAPQHRWADRCNYMLVCRPCHQGPLANMPHELQLAYKFVCDPEHFDLERWLALRDPSVSVGRSVTMHDIGVCVVDVINDRRLDFVEAHKVQRRLNKLLACKGRDATREP